MIRTRTQPLRADILRHVLGSTFHLAGQIGIGGTAQDMTGWHILSHARGPSGLIDLGARWANAAEGILELYATPAAQTEWHRGLHRFDIRLESPDRITIVQSAAADIIFTEAIT